MQMAFRCPQIRESVAETFCRGALWASATYITTCDTMM